MEFQRIALWGTCISLGLGPCACPLMCLSGSLSVPLCVALQALGCPSVVHPSLLSPSRPLESLTSLEYSSEPCFCPLGVSCIALSWLGVCAVEHRSLLARVEHHFLLARCVLHSLLARCLCGKASLSSG